MSAEDRVTAVLEELGAPDLLAVNVRHELAGVEDPSESLIRHVARGIMSQLNARPGGSGGGPKTPSADMPLKEMTEREKADLIDEIGLDKFLEKLAKETYG